MHTLILTWASWLLMLLLPPQQQEIAFYQDRFEVAYQPLLFANGPLELTELGIDYHYARVTEGDWLPIHQQLQVQRQRLGLNDWLYAKLVHECIGGMADFASRNERRVLEAHLLTLAGHDVRLCYDAQELFVYAHTADELFEVPLIEDGDRQYFNVSAALAAHPHRTRSLSMHPLRPLPAGRPIAFSLDRLPQLSSNLQRRTFRFTFEDSAYSLQAVSDRTIADWMNDYPFFAEGRYVEAPMSAEPHRVLLNALRPHLDSLDNRQALRFLAAFTRGAFDYKEDKTSFGYSKPMIPDEVLYYPMSDCEDRSALYFSLVRDLLDLPVIAIAYDDHLSIAVAEASLSGKAYTYNGRRYYVCDPTGPKESSTIGNPPAGYYNRPFQVVASYVPGA